MPYRTTDLRTAINRAALFMSVGKDQRCLILSHRKTRDYMVIDCNLLDDLQQKMSDAGYHIAIDLMPDEILRLTGHLQLCMLEDDVYAISQKDL